MRLLAAILLVLATIALVSGQNCKLATGGKNYDFSGLANATSYSVSDSNKNTYFFNVCNAASKCNGIGPLVASCQQGATGTSPTADCGHTNAVVAALNAGDGGQLTYGSGGACSGGVTRSTNVQMMCVKGAATSVVSVNEISKCTYVIKLNSGKACPTGGGTGTTGGSGTTGGTTTGGTTGGNDGSSTDNGGHKKKGGIGGGWIFVIILLVSTTVYIVAGIIINYKVRGLSGKEMFPNYGFWSEFPGLLKDGVFFIKGKITGSGSSAGYQQV